MKSAKIAAVILILFSFFANTAVATASEIQSPPEIAGEAGIVMDVETGRVLYEKNAHLKLEPASTTKIMTAILALEKGDLSDIVTTGKNPTLVDGTRIYLEEGETLTLEQMLYAMMLNSANDAAVAIAEHMAGSVESFAAMMNEKAREIGAKDTNFVNPNGLPAAGHLTTAYDLALISRYALLNLPEFRKIVATKTAVIPWQGQEWDRQLINLNKLLWNYEGADGIKTGYTSTAGSTIVASATRNGRQLIAVILKSNGTTSKDCSALLDYGFNNFERKSLLKSNSVIAEKSVTYGSPVKLVTEKEFVTIVPKNDLPITKKAYIADNIDAPVKKGDILGHVIFYQGCTVLGSVNLVAANTVKRKVYTYWWFWVISPLFAAYAPYRISIGVKRYRRSRLRKAQAISPAKRYK